MENSPPIRSLSELLTDLKSSLNAETIGVQAMLEAFHERGFGFFLFLLALPASLPLPPIGINTIISLPLLLLTGQQALGRHTIWLPEDMKAKSVKSANVAKIIDAALPWVQRAEYFIKPRLAFLTQGIFSNLIGVLGFIMSLSVSLPLPLMHTVPSFGIATMSLGVLSRDGLAVILGAVIGIGWITMLACAVIFFGEHGVEIAKEAINSFFH